MYKILAKLPRARRLSKERKENGVGRKYFETRCILSPPHARYGRGL